MSPCCRLLSVLGLLVYLGCGDGGPAQPSAGTAGLDSRVASATTPETGPLAPLGLGPTQNTLHGVSSANVSIPDDDDGAGVSSAITLSGAPAGATITNVQVYYEIRHTFPGDLEISLRGLDATGNEYLEFYEQGDLGSADDVVEQRSNITAFNGGPPNQTWRLHVRDRIAQDVGYIDYFEIWVTYETEATPAPTTIIYPPYAGAYRADHWWNDTVLLSGRAIALEQDADERSFDFQSTTLGTAAILSGRIYGHAGLVVVDDYRIPFSVSEAGSYQVQVDMSVDGDRVAAVLDIFASTAASASSGDLYAKVLDSSGNIVGGSSGGNRVAWKPLWDDDFSLGEVGRELSETALEGITTLIPAGAVAHGSYAGITIIVDFLEYLTTLPSVPIPVLANVALDGLSLVPGEQYELSIQMRTFSWASAYGLGASAATHASGSVEVDRIVLTRTDSVAGGSAVGDAYEPNDSWQEATQLGPMDSELSLTQLGIVHGDVDYYRFTLVNQGTAADYVSLYLSSPSTGEGDTDIDLALGKLNNSGNFYPATGRWLDVMSRSETNFETLSLNGLPPGEYFAIVFGQSGFDLSEDGTPNPDLSGTEASPYSLDIHAPDAFEGDNIAAQAKQIPTDGTPQRHSLPGDDVDWIAFTLAEPAEAVVTVFATDFHELDLTLYGPDSPTLNLADASLGSNEDSAQIRFEGESHLSAGIYYLEVHPSFGLQNNLPRYTVVVDAVPLSALPTDFDGDGVPYAGGAQSCIGGNFIDCEDNCPDIANENQLDRDEDGVGDLCDNCVEAFNPRLGDPSFPMDAPLPEVFQHMSGDQLDDDQDGFGNHCDAKFGTLGQFVGGTDITEIRASFNKDRSGSDCGVGGDQPCAQFDLDNAGQFIGGPDVSRARALFNLPPGPKCDACPLSNSGE